MQVFRTRKDNAVEYLDEAKAVVLEHQPIKFAATALGQIFCSLHGVKVVLHCKTLLVPVLIFCSNVPGSWRQLEEWPCNVQVAALMIDDTCAGKKGLSTPPAPPPLPPLPPPPPLSSLTDAGMHCRSQAS